MDCHGVNIQPISAFRLLISLGIALGVHVQTWYLYLLIGDSTIVEQLFIRIQMKPGVFREEYIAIIRSEEHTSELQSRP